MAARSKTAPVWMQKWLWPLEDEFGSVVNVPEDDPRLKLLRLAMRDPGLSDEQYEHVVAMARETGKLSVKKREANGSIKQYDHEVWNWHKQGKTAGWIGLELNQDSHAIISIVNRLQGEYHDTTNYTKRLLVRMIATGASDRDMMRATGFKYEGTLHRALKRYGLEE